MAIPRPPEVQPLGPWPRGGNNIAREDSVPGSSYRRGINVDTYPGGKLRRRKGSTTIVETPTTNLWSDGQYSLVLAGDTLHRFIPGEDLIPLFTGFDPEDDLVYVSANNLIYVSNGQFALRVNTFDDSVRPWGVVTPAGQPTLSIVDGGLDPGGYQVAITYMTSDLEESGCNLAATIDLPDGGGIHATYAPVAPAYVTWLNVYVTRAGGEEFRYYGRYPANVPLDIVITKQQLGRPLRTFGREPMPAGTTAAFAAGRLLASVGPILFWSEPLYFGLTDLTTNFYVFSAHIDMIAPASPGGASTGVYVAAGARTYFLQGDDLKAATNQIAYHVGAVPGQPVYVAGDAFEMQGLPPQPLPMWLAANGQPCIGFPSGQVLSLTNARYETEVGDRVSLAQRELLGINQVVLGVRSGAATSGVSGDSASAVVIRNGVVIP